MHLILFKRKAMTTQIKKRSIFSLAIYLKIILSFLLVFFEGCVVEKSELKIKVINKSYDKVYIGNLLSSCDSCDIMRDLRFQCSSNKPSILRILNAKDSIDLIDKLLETKIRMYAIRADSLDYYCNSRKPLNDIKKKQWVKILSSVVNMGNRTCTIVIK